MFEVIYTEKRKVSKYGVISGTHFPLFGLNTEIYSVISVFSLNAGKWRSERTPYLDTFHARVSLKIKLETKTISLFRVALQTLKYGQKVFQSFINPFHATGLFRYLLKTSTSQRFSYVFRGYWKRPVVWNGLKRLF